MNSILLQLDGKEIAVTAGATLLEAAAQAGITIPNLCFSKEFAPGTSCLTCLVKINSPNGARWVPSCATRAEPAMVVESESEEVHAARRAALELLLSDHLGDCLSPCARICPLRLNIPRLFRQVAQRQWPDAIATLLESLPLPGVLARLCHRPCENGCRRGVWDQPAAIRDLEMFVADRCDDPQFNLPPPALTPPASSGKTVAIVGAGPCGLTAAWQLQKLGHACTIFDRNAAIGGALRAVPQSALPNEILSRERRRLERLGIQFRLGESFASNLRAEKVAGQFDACLLAVGEISKEESRALGLSCGGSLEAHPETGRLPAPNWFAAGSMIRPIKQALRAMADGQAVAWKIDRFLCARQPAGADKPFSCMMGRLDRGEVELFLRHASALPRVKPSFAQPSFSPEQAAEEALRCLHCDCRAVETCRLKLFAERYGADPTRYRSQRARFEQVVHSGHIIFEPGKCIRCGLCIQVAEKAGEPLGLAFIGRGFDVRIGAPFGEALERGLQTCGAECAAICPTGALVVNGAPPGRS